MLCFKFYLAGLFKERYNMWSTFVHDTSAEESSCINCNDSYPAQNERTTIVCTGNLQKCIAMYLDEQKQECLGM